MLAYQLAFIGGLTFDPFFRGFLSVMVGVFVLCGSVYLLLATNTGTRTGFFLAATGLFGWMTIMGIMWTTRGIGWIGTTPTWDTVEINRGELDVATEPSVRALAGLDIASHIPPNLTETDEINAAAVEYADQIKDQLHGWRLLPPGDQDRGEGQAAADAHLVAEGVFDASKDYVPLEFGAFDRGGKEHLDPASNSIERVAHWFRTSIIKPFHPRHLMVIQVQGVRPQFVEPGQPPATPEADPSQPVVSIVMERNMGGPIPRLIGGRRFTPLMFTLFSGIVFLVLAASLHNRDKREMAIRAGSRS
jgi:hypothetical protein